MVDTFPIIDSRFNIVKKNIEVPMLKDDIWHDLFKKYKVVKTTNPKSWSPLFTNFSYTMEKYNIHKTNLVIQARSHRKAIAEARYNLYKNLREKNLDSKTIYIIDGMAHLRHLKYLYKNNEEVSFFKGDNIWSFVLDEKKMRDSDIESFSKIEPKLLEIDKRKKLSITDNDSYYGFGWSHNLGKPGIWSDGPVSSLLFKTEKQKGDFQLEIFCSPYVSKKDKTLNFDIFVNDIFSKKISLKKDNKENIKILIENNSIENNEVKIDFHFKNLTSPLKELKSPDSRKLGILVESIYIRPI